MGSGIRTHVSWKTRVLPLDDPQGGGRGLKNKSQTGLMQNGCGGWVRTNDFQIMTLTIYRLIYPARAQGDALSLCTGLNRCKPKMRPLK